MRLTFVPFSAVDSMFYLLSLLFCVFSVSAPLHLSAYTDAYVTAELDKLMTNRLYTDVLVMEDEEEQTQTEGEPGSGATEPPAPTPSASSEPTTSKGAPSKPSRKRGAQKEKPPTPLQKLGHWAGQNPNIKMPGQYARQTYKGAAPLYSLSNASQLSRISEYLYENAGLNIAHTPKDGDCLYHSCRVAMDLPQEYVPMLMKRQIIVFMAQNAKICSEIFNPTIQGTYGDARMDPEQFESLKKAKALSPKQIEKQELPGPFSYLGYLKHQLKEGSWGDEIMVTAMSMMWQITVTILYAETLTEHRIRHDRLVGKVDMVVVFCGGCHYVGASELN